MTELVLVLPGANGVELDKRNANAFVEQVMSSSFTSICKINIIFKNTEIEYLFIK